MLRRRGKREKGRTERERMVSGKVSEKKGMRQREGREAGG